MPTGGMIAPVIVSDFERGVQMDRRKFLRGAALALSVAGVGPATADVPTHRWDGYDFGAGPRAAGRLNQGPFAIEQDDGWFTIASTTASEKPVRNFGCGLVGYAREEGGPSLAAREGRETLEQHIEKISSLPFVDVLYIRCDWRDVQQRAGRLDLEPVFALALDAARRKGLRIAFRVQMSNTVGQPERLALPDFLQAKVPLVKIGRLGGEYGAVEYREPRYDHPELQRAFRELNELLAAEFDANPLVEWVDLMQYGFWGEGHTSSLPAPFPDYHTAETLFTAMTQLQLDTWKRAVLAVNTQPDISRVGNREVIDRCVRAGCWLRSDSILVDEPEQIEALSNRPPWLAVVMEDGYYRHYDVARIPVDEAGVNRLENSILHVLDLGANYWSLWTESDNLRRYHDRYPKGLTTLQQRMGYRVRPSWVWQRKRYGTSELVVAFKNDGVAGVPGVLRVSVESQDGRVLAEGALDAGHPLGGKVRLASFVLPKGFEGSTVKLRAAIETKGGIRRPVVWACAQPLTAEGAFAVRLKPFSDHDWRKNV